MIFEPSLFSHILHNQQMTHYNFLTCETSGLEENGSLLTLKVTARPWEFVQLLSTGTIQDEIKPGEVLISC